MSDTIIAGLDLDAPPQARDALALATWLADVTSSALLLVTVFAPGGDALSTQLERRRRQLGALADRPVDTMAVAGTAPARLLHELADQRRPRALVIGSSRSGAEGRVSVGSAGELLLHGGGAPVVVAPNGFRPPSGRSIDIGVGYGVTPESDDAVRVAVDLAKRAGARLRVLHVRVPSPHHEMQERRPGEHLERALAGASAECVELEGDPVGAMATASGGLDLLVVGSRSYGPLGAVLLGAVTRRLVHAAECPLMVVPRTRDAALAVALIGGMEAAVED
ncbi:MAG TPA: universal stress protein [Solirubrobacteraceae bacterium]|jgi:nucleotide-binding universal stress UspA family protein|nr:universal stress protein [Solirubrobacteraceae bacterium]